MIKIYCTNTDYLISQKSSSIVNGEIQVEYCFIWQKKQDDVVVGNQYLYSLVKDVVTSQDYYHIYDNDLKYFLYMDKKIFDRCFIEVAKYREEQIKEILNG